MYKLITPPAVPAITLATAKAYLRVVGTTNDTQITGIINGAIFQAQQYAFCQFINATWEKQFTDWPFEQVLTLGKGQVSSITSLVYNDINGTEQTWADTNYKLDNYSKPTLLKLIADSLPTLNVKNPYIRVRFVAGFGAADTDVPEDVKDALALMVVEMYNTRTDERPPMPKASERILSQYRNAYFTTY